MIVEANGSPDYVRACETETTNILFMNQGRVDFVISKP